MSLKKGKKSTVKAKVYKVYSSKSLFSHNHGPQVSYRTDNKAVAVVNSNGVITAKGTGEPVSPFSLHRS